MESRKLFIFSVCFICVVTSKGEISPFITSGINADIRDIPFLVSIQLGTVHICTGSLLSEKFSISSARCMSNRNINNLLIEYGASIINTTNQDRNNVIRINKIIMHPNYNATSLENDITIIEAQSEIKLSDFLDPFAFLASAGTRFSSGILATHAGWGHTSLNQRNTILQRAYLKIISQQECINAVGETKVPFFNSICAMDESVICAGDLGAPLLVNRVLVGIASFRNGNECENIPGQFPNVYTAVSFYIEWIENVTGINYRVNTFLSRN